MQLVRCSWIAAQIRLDLLQRARVDEVAELLLAEQLPEQVAVERQRLRAPLGRRRVVLVHVRRDVVEEQRGRIGRGRRGLDVDHVDLPRAEPLEQLLERRAGRRRPGDTRGTSPGRSGTPGSGARPAAATAPSGAAARAACARPGGGAGSGGRAPAFSRNREPNSAVCPISATTRSSSSSGSGISSSVGGGASASGRWKAIPSSDQIDCASIPTASRSRAPDRHRPRRVDAGAERREDADAPVADLVAEALDDDRPVGGTAPVAASCSRRKPSRLLAALSSSWCSSLQPLQRFRAARRDQLPRELRRSARRARTASRRPRPSRTARRPGTPGAGETSTRSRVISSIRQVEAPSRNV